MAAVASASKPKSTGKLVGRSKVVGVVPESANPVSVDVGWSAPVGIDECDSLASDTSDLLDKSPSLSASATSVDEAVGGVESSTEERVTAKGEELFDALKREPGGGEGSVVLSWFVSILLCSCPAGGQLESLRLRSVRGKGSDCGLDACSVATFDLIVGFRLLAFRLRMRLCVRHPD